MKENANSSNVLRVDNKIVEEVKKFVHLGSRVSEERENEEDINNRLSRVNQAFAIKHNK